MIISITIGCITLTYLLLTYLKTEEKFIIKLFLFLVMLPIPPVYGIVLNTIAVNSMEYINAIINLLHFIFLLLSYSSLFFIAYLTTSLLDIKVKKAIDFGTLLLFSIAIVLSYFSSTYSMTDSNKFAIYYYRCSWLQFIHFLPSIYLSSLVFIRKKLNTDLFKSWIGVRLSITLLISIPLILFDIYKVFIDLYLFLPLIYISISIQILVYLKKVYKIKKIRLNDSGLTGREKELVQLIIKGLSNTDISKKLNISISTVKNHVYNIYKKLNIKNRYELLNKISD